MGYLDFRDQLVAAPLKPAAGSFVPATSSRDFRDQLVAAPLKPTPSGTNSSAIGHFRDQLVAAPLKHFRLMSPPWRRGNFRDQLVAAPLKHDPLRRQSNHADHISATNWSRPH